MSALVFNPFITKDDKAITTLVNSSGSPWRALSETLDRPDYVIIQRAFQLGLVRFNKYNHVLLSHRTDGWRSDEVDYLIAYAGKVSAKTIAGELGRTDASISKQIYEFKLSQDTEWPWRDEELALLRQEINVNGAGYVAKYTGRCLVDVKHQAIKQGWCEHGMALTIFPGRRKTVKFDEVFV